jgi:hypothetical protein
VHYLIFIPGATPATLEQTAKIAGLSDLLEGGHDVMASDGPNGQSGLMLGWLSPLNPHMHVDKSKQEWLPSILKSESGESRYHVGIWKDNVPTQSELRRHYTQKGVLTQFGKERWILPTPDTVDARAVYADDGTMRWEVTRQFSWLCDEAKLITEQYLSEFGLRQMVFSVNPSAQVEWLLKLLRINYRMLPELAVYLDLWVGRDHLMDVFLKTLGLVRKTGAADA